MSAFGSSELYAGPRRAARVQTVGRIAGEARRTREVEDFSVTENGRRWARGRLANRRGGKLMAKQRTQPSGTAQAASKRRPGAPGMVPPGSKPPGGARREHSASLRGHRPSRRSRARLPGCRAGGAGEPVTANRCRGRDCSVSVPLWDSPCKERRLKGGSLRD
jgi:hypothetical protein